MDFIIANRFAKIAIQFILNIHQRTDSLFIIYLDVHQRTDSLFKIYLDVHLRTNSLFKIQIEFPLANRFAIGKCRWVLNSEVVRYSKCRVPPLAKQFAIQNVGGTSNSEVVRYQPYDGASELATGPTGQRTTSLLEKAGRLAEWLVASEYAIQTEWPALNSEPPR